MHLLQPVPTTFASTAKLGSAIISAAAITLLLFAAMQQLILAQSVERPVEVERPVVELYQPPEETDIAVKPTMPKPPPPVERDIPRFVAPTDEVTDVTPNGFDKGELAPKMTAVKQDWQNQPRDKTAAPIVRIEPRYPQQAYIDKLFALHGTDLYHFLLQQADKQLAEDISQQCWLKIIDNRLCFRGDSSFKTWLFAIGRNSLIDELRRKNRMPLQQAADETLPANTEPEQQLQQQRYQQQLGAALQVLPFFQREALMLQLEGFSLAQIAQITVEAEETVKSRLRYARQRLLSQVGGCDDNT